MLHSIHRHTCLNKYARLFVTKCISVYPVYVRVSAGIGRTGTFVAFDNLVAQARAEGVVRPLQAVETLRRQRVNMVQTPVSNMYSLCSNIPVFAF